MRWGTRVCAGLLLGAALFAPLGTSVGHTQDTEDLRVIVHASARVGRLTADQLEAIYTRSMTRWDDGSMIIPFNLSDSSPLRHRFDRVVLRLDPPQVGRFWLDQRIRGLGAPPKQVPDVSLLVKVVERLPGSVGYVPATRVSNKVKVVARISGNIVVVP